MTNQTQSIPLNSIQISGQSGVRVYSKELDAHLIFEAHRKQTYGVDQNSVEFKCAVFDSAALTHAKYIPMAPEQARHGRSANAQAKSLDQLVADLNWAHTAADLALLRMHLAGRRLTCCGELIGDSVLYQMPQAEVDEARGRRLAALEEQLRKDGDDLVNNARTLVDAHIARALDAARYGVTMALPNSVADLTA